MQISLPILLMLVSQATAACDSFATNGSTAAYYKFHRFYDFRNLPTDTEATSVCSAPDQYAKIHCSVPWSSDWKSVSWQRPTFQYTPSAISITNDPTDSEHSRTQLTLHTSKLADGTQLAGQLDYTEQEVMYASIRVLARVYGASGAVAGIFTYHNDTEESDIEVLTRDPSTQVHFSNQPTEDLNTGAPIPGATFNKTLAGPQRTSEWNVYRLDWIPSHSAWYVNGAQAVSTEVNVPNVASMVILNMWSNGGPFSGVMQPGGEAWLDVQWIELLFNTTTTGTNRDTPGTICSVESSPGVPVPLS